MEKLKGTSQNIPHNKLVSDKNWNRGGEKMNLQNADTLVKNGGSKTSGNISERKKVTNESTGRRIEERIPIKKVGQKEIISAVKMIENGSQKTTQNVSNKTSVSDYDEKISTLKQLSAKQSSIFKAEGNTNEGNYRKSNYGTKSTTKKDKHSASQKVLKVTNEHSASEKGSKITNEHSALEKVSKITKEHSASEKGSKLTHEHSESEKVLKVTNQHSASEKGLMLTTDVEELIGTPKQSRGLTLDGPYYRYEFEGDENAEESENTVSTRNQGSRQLDSQKDEKEEVSLQFLPHIEYSEKGSLQVLKSFLTSFSGNRIGKVLYSDEIAIMSEKLLPPESKNNLSFISDTILSSEISFGGPIVLITHVDVPEEVIQKLKETCTIRLFKKTDSRKKVIRKVKGAHAIFLAGTHLILDKEFFKDHDLSSLKVVSTMNHTYNYMDVVELTRRNVRIGTARTPPIDTIAELALQLAIATTYKFVKALDPKRKQDSDADCTFIRELYGSVCGIVGSGEIVNSISQKLLPFSVSKILQANPGEYVKADTKKNSTVSDKVPVTKVDFLKLLKESDFIFVVCPLLPATLYLFNRKTFKRMKSTAILIDISVEGVVNSDDLAVALEKQQIIGAGIDVTHPKFLQKNHPLLQLNNCLVTPRISTATNDTRMKMAHMTADNILAALEDSQMPSEVCFKIRKLTRLVSSHHRLPLRYRGTIFHDKYSVVLNKSNEANEICIHDY